MKPLPDGTFRYSPHDLVAFLDGDFAAWCERMLAERGRAAGAAPDPLQWATPDEGDEEAALAKRKGDEHEQRYLARLRERYPTLVALTRDDPDGLARTLAAMAAGEPVIYQGHLMAAGWGGFPDFLFRCEGGDGCNGWHYTPWDTKLARSAKPAFLVQLCAYADMLEALRGYLPTELVFVFGQGEERPYRTHQYYHYYRRLRGAFTAFQEGWSADRRPEPGMDKSWGRWEKAAEELLKQSDHLSLVANITRGQVARLEDAGITTLTALAGYETGRRVSKVSDQVFERLREQAKLQLESRDLLVPLWRHRPRDPNERRRGLAILPAPSDGDVFFDMEGFPYAEGGLEYLFGVVTVADDVVPVFRDWWAHDAAGERVAFEGFIDWLVERRQRYPDLHVYHYAAYEESAVKRLAAKFATRELEVDELLRGEVFVDLYNVVRQGFIVGTTSYSLKKIEHLYEQQREGQVVTAGGSVVEYQKWIDSGEAREWQESLILKGIRDYNQKDCESVWALRSWLLDRQLESGISYLPPAPMLEPKRPVAPERAEAEALSVRLRERAKTETGGAEQGRLDELLGCLVEYHRREDRPEWWALFERHDRMTVEQRFEDAECLAGLVRTVTPPVTIKQSRGLEYRFNPQQETKLHAGSTCHIAGDKNATYEITRLDEDAGLVEIKAGPSKSPEDRICLIGFAHYDEKEQRKAILRYATAWERGEIASRAVDDLLRRRPPRIRDHDGGPLVREGDDTVGRACELVGRLDGSTLCIQGPPGTGKTYTAAAMIVTLLGDGASVAVTAQSHKVIMNVLGAVADEMQRRGVAGSLYKVGEHDGDELVRQGVIRELENDEVPGAAAGGTCVVGGTSFLLSREELTGVFDYLFIDEAGQFALANAVAVGQAARNLVLVGDQMQLAQVTKGAHPGDTGLSCLEYYLAGKATVPPELGIFLEKTRRMHPDVCRFVSKAIYEGRLDAIPETSRHRVLRAPDTALVPAETGIAWVPVEHDGRTQSSDEECERIAAIVDELLRRRVVDKDGVERALVAEDIIVVAPFNLQVRCLRQRLDPRIRVGSVDKFQGQEAPVAIVSLCSSTLADAPRGATFLLSPNRLNVAVSRAQALVIVVGCPELMDVRCHSLEEMRLVNLLCHLVQYAEEGRQA